MPICYNQPMTNPPYDKTSVASIVSYATGLTGKSLRDFMTNEELASLSQNTKNKGDLGNLVEKFYFDINPGNSSKPDFLEAGLELKTAAVKEYKKKTNGLKYGAKERLKLSKINFNKVGQEDWDSNTLFQKCRHILLLMYLFDVDLEVISRIFVMHPITWELSEKDLAFIKADWEIINQKIKRGEAHLLSGSDTKYLEACTSGTGALVSQPFSPVEAKERSFAFKASYINSSFLADAKFVENLEPLLKEGESPEDFEAIITSRVESYRGKSIDIIADELGCTLSRAKHRLALLSKVMLGIKSKYIEEFEKSGIEIKTVNFSPKGTPVQDMSFPAFSYLDIVKEDWEDSTFKQKIDTKLLFMIFQTQDDGSVVFKKAHFWSMPRKDFKEAKRVWEETKNRVDTKRADKLPLKDFSQVAHVRNHSKNSKPESYLETPHNGRLPEKGFWLNAQYIKSQLENLL